MSKDLDSITILRGFLALAIVWGHLEVVPLKVFNLDLFFLISFPGRIIVWLFFIVSGYSIYCGYRSNKYGFDMKDTLRFYFNRAIRIFPLFYITILIAWICFSYISPKDLPSWQSIIRTMFFGDFNLTKGIYTFTPTWFIGIIFYFYCFTPLLVKGYLLIKEKLSFRETFLLLLLLSVISHWLGYLSSNSYDIRNFVGCFSLFLFGFYAYDLQKESHIIQAINKGIRNKPLFYLTLLTLFGFTFFIYDKFNIFFFVLPMEGFIGTLGIALLYSLLFKNPSDFYGKTNIIYYGRKILEKLGHRSYGLYLWHPIVIVLFLRTEVLGIKGPPYQSIYILFQAFLITVVMSYIISAIFYQLLEKPYHSLYRGRE